MGRYVDVTAVDALSTVGCQGSASNDFDDGQHEIPVFAHEPEIRFDVCAKCRAPSRFSEDPRDHVRPSGFDDLDHDLPNEVIFAREVVADHALADPDPRCNSSERRLGEANLGDRVDGRGNDLLAAGVLDEGPLLGFGPRVGHDQKLRELATETNFNTLDQT